MPTYKTTPFKASPILAVAGTPTYLFGSYNDRTSPTLGYVISDSAVTTTGTVTFQITSGNIPIVGAPITVVGTGNAAGNFNVTNATILTVSTTDAGVCTVTYAITSSSVPVGTADGGQVIVPQTEIGETIVTNTATASIPVATPYNNPEMQEGKSLSATISFPNTGSLSAVTAVLQGADFDVDTEYRTVHTFTATGAANNRYNFQSGEDTIAPSATPGAISSNPGGVNVPNYRFWRFNLTAVTGTGPVIAKIEF